jgi:hypothetical protein
MDDCTLKHHKFGQASFKLGRQVTKPRRSREGGVNSHEIDSCLPKQADKKEAALFTNATSFIKKKL